MAYGGFINGRRRGTREESRKVSTRFSLSMEMSRLTRDGTAEPVSRDQILRHARGQGNIHFPCSADHEQDWQPYPVDPYSAILVCDDHTYIQMHVYQVYSPFSLHIHICKRHTKNDQTYARNHTVEKEGGNSPNPIALLVRPR